MTGAALDMSLDNLIKNNKKFDPQGRGCGSGPGRTRCFLNCTANRVAPYVVAKALESAWGHETFVDGDQASIIEIGMKLYLSDLEYGVSNEDIKELFSKVGDLKQYTIHYDRSGRSNVLFKFGLIWCCR